MVSDLPVTYPNLAGKHAHDAFVNPSEAIAYARNLGQLDGLKPPECLILCYQRSLLSYIRKQEGLDDAVLSAGFRGFVSLPSTAGRVGVVGGFGYGAPMAAQILEEFVALGTTSFISIGTAGGLRPTARLGDLVVCDRAVRDEGVSHHYLAPGTYAEASPELTAALVGELSSRGLDHQVGSSWTIDAPYRETMEEVRHYQRAGVACVEMEAAALFAVGSYRSVQVASALAISDSLAGVAWAPGFRSPETALALQGLYDVALAVLCSGVS